MFNNDAINVVLGLILVFLLYSLLASIIMESIARKLGLRAHMLIKAISKILDDSDFKKGTYARRFFYSFSEIYYLDPFKKRSLTALFYSHPNIINLGKDSYNSKPSYISDELFAETVIQILRGDKFSGHQNQIELIKENLANKNGFLPIPSYFILPDTQKGCENEPKTYLLVKEKELFNQKEIEKNLGMPKYNSGNLPKRSKRHSNNKNNALKYIKIHPLTFYQIQQTLFDSHQDVDWLKTKLKKWYNETQERALGWYIKQTRSFLFSIGLLIAVVFNVDCIAIGTRLSTDKTLRNSLVEKAIEKSKIKPMDNNTFDTAMANLNSINNSIVIGERKWRNIPGWILTAIAISLGASFWFDLLNRIMALRNAGQNPIEKNNNKHLMPDEVVG